MKFAAFYAHCAKFDLAHFHLPDCIEFIANHFVSVVPNAAPSSCDLASRPNGIADAAGESGSPQPLLVLLLVDEIAKSLCEDDIMTLVGGVCDDSPRLADHRACFVLPVFTSLSETRMSKLLTGSRRPILPVLLKVPLVSASAAMKVRLQLPPAFDTLIDVLCRDVGYHGRMLESIVDILAPESAFEGSIRAELVTSADEPFQNLPHIYTLIRTHKASRSYFSRIVQIADSLFHAICVCLLGKSVPLGSNILRKLSDEASASDVGPSYDDLLEQGVFISNASTVNGFITPVISPLQLTWWAAQLLNCTADTMKKNFLSAIIRAFCPVTENNWKKFEKFQHSTPSLISDTHRGFLHFDLFGFACCLVVCGQVSR
jgi:hypothetical protein